MILVERCPYKSIVVKNENEENVTITEGSKVKFVIEDDGQLKKGIVVGFKGTKPEKLEIEMIPNGGGHREIWAVTKMTEGTLQLVNEDDEE